MSKLSNNIKRLLYRNLSLEAYLRVVSRMFFVGYGLGLGRRSPAYEYPRFLKRLVRRGDTVIDIGANLGYYSGILARRVGPEGRVYAVEPVKPILGVLRKNLRRFRNVEIMPYALGAEDKCVLLGNDSSRYAGYMGTGRNRVLEKAGPPAEGTENAEKPGDKDVMVIEFAADMRRGSELFAGLERLDFVKCDIEGYETVVLSEMAPVIERFRPVVMVETGGPNRKEILKMFRTWGYAGYVLEEGRLISVMRAPEKDIVFIPGHRHGEFEEYIVKN